MVDSVFVLHILASFLEYKSQENAPKIIFIAEMAYIHVSTKYIKKKCDFENFFKFRYTLMPPPLPLRIIFSQKKCLKLKENCLNVRVNLTFTHNKVYTWFQSRFFLFFVTGFLFPRIRAPRATFKVVLMAADMREGFNNPRHGNLPLTFH